MASYLHIHCGPHQLLLDAAHVVEVADCRHAADARDDGYRAWRDRLLPVLDLPRFLGVGDDRRAQQLVVSLQADSGVGDHILDVDRVERLVALDAGRFQPVSAVTDALDALVDGAWREGDAFLLRLRQPFAWQTVAGTAATPGDAR